MSRRGLAIVAAAITLAGCAQTQSLWSDVSTRVSEITRGSSTTSPGAGDIRPTDRFCASLEESYEVTDNILRIALAGATQAFLAWQRDGFRITPQSRRQLETFVKELSKRYLWMPVFIEEQIGTYLHDEYPKDKIVARGGRGRDGRAYDRADRALTAAAKDYPKIPYELRLFVVESDVINAEALPAGYIYVSRRAVADLDDAALKLILGHEVAHVAKRHTSKQIQQRIVDIGMSLDVLQQVVQGRGTAVDRKVLSGWSLFDRLQGIFARYDQDQELQADACSIRSMVYAGEDPILARQEYRRMRGGEATQKRADAAAPARRAFGLSYTEHPDDEAREKFFREATSFHRANAGQPATRVSATGAPVTTQGTPPDAPKGAEAKPQPASAGCGKIEFDRSVRGDAEPLFTKLSDKDRRKLQTAICLKSQDADGVWGPKTKHSLKQYECRMGRDPVGTLTAAVIAELLRLGPDEVKKHCAAP